MAETVTQITQPAPFIEAESKLYLDQLKNAIGGVKGLDLSKIMGPQFVAGMDPLTQQAIGQASGLGSYAPFLQQAEALTGPTAYQQLICLHINKMLLVQLYKNMIFKHKKVYRHWLHKLLLQVHLVVVEKVFKEQNIYLHQIETELHYKHNYYNKVLGKHKDLAATRLSNSNMGLAEQAAPAVSRSRNFCINYIRWFRSISITSSTFCTTTTCTTTSISTFINCTAIWFRNHGSNIRIPWTNRNTSISITYSISKYIRCRCNTCWNI
jgi:hypothetical protein